MELFYNCMVASLMRFGIRSCRDVALLQGDISLSRYRSESTLPELPSRLQITLDIQFLLDLLCQILYDFLAFFSYAIYHFICEYVTLFTLKKTQES